KQLELLQKLAGSLDEVVVLCTCNRTEVIYRTTSDEGHRAVRGVFASIGGTDEARLDTMLYVFHGTDALHHLFRVAASIDRRVAGETQIVGQVKDAFHISFQHGCAKTNFNRIFQRMLQTVKRIRNETGLGQGTVSVGSVAVQRAVNIFEDLSTKRVL